eukprot:TRINITY_DN63562_c0_g1_i1.p1 TRINITY_DN63562_c0_g1~~TRINITY_DN63562_c0_g1_i1.p1  ORF type:complete len:262 (+),score=70.20 TRINITY_DN63562_c0_g1_i1:60-788(+)
MAGEVMPPSCDGEQVVITDEVVERLLTSLELLQADYERTVAASVAPSENKQGSVSTNALDSAEGGPSEVGVMHEANAEETAWVGGDEDDDEEEDNGELGHGYSVLGSDDDEDDEVPIQGGDTASMQADAMDLDDTETVPCDLVDEGVSASGDVTIGAAWHTCEPSKAEVMGLDGKLENFADFDSAKLEPPDPAPFEIPPLTDEEQGEIKDAMRQLDIKAPPWATHLSDVELRRMIRQISKTI